MSTEIHIADCIITNANGYTINQLNTEIPDSDYKCRNAGIRIPLNYGMGIEITYDGEKYIMKRGGLSGGAKVILKINTWKGISSTAIHYNGKLKITLPEMTRVDKDGYTCSCWDIPMFKNNSIELTQVLEQWEIDKYRENYEFLQVGSIHRGFYSVELLKTYAKQVFEQLFENTWKYEVKGNY